MDPRTRCGLMGPATCAGRSRACSRRTGCGRLPGSALVQLLRALHASRRLVAGLRFAAFQTRRRPLWRRHRARPSGVRRCFRPAAQSAPARAVHGFTQSAGKDERVLDVGRTASTPRRPALGLARAVAHGAWTFFRTYLLQAGFLDGREGFMLAVPNAEALITST